MKLMKRTKEILALQTLLKTHERAKAKREQQRALKEQKKDADGQQDSQ